MNHPSPFHYAVASEINEIIKMNFYGIISPNSIFAPFAFHDGAQRSRMVKKNYM